MIFSRKYFLLTIAFLIAEILIALYVNDDFIRPYLGDTLVVMLIYCFLRTFFAIKTHHAIAIVIVFAIFIEYLQYLDFVRLAGIESKMLRIVLGSSFSWNDIIAYLAGAAIIAIVERLNNKSS